MAKPGPRPKPTALKKLDGNPGKRPLPEGEPMPQISSSVPLPPKTLDAVAKAEWNRTAANLYKLGLLTENDLTAFMGYCVCFSHWVNALKEIEKNGVLIKAQSGFPVQSPWISIANKSMVEMRKWLVEFGMTPSSRTGINADKLKDDDGADLLT